MKQSGPLRFLVVDDHAENRQVAAWLLQTAFLETEIVEASTIEQISDALESRRVDCVLLDSATSDFKTVLPALWMHSQVARVPVVLLAGERHLVQHRLATEQGVSYRLMKEDVSPRLVLQVVRTAIEVSALRLMLDEQGRELERLHSEVENSRTSSPVLVAQPVSAASGHGSACDVSIVDVRPIDPTGASQPAPGSSRLVSPPLITASVRAPTDQEDDLARRIQKKLLPPGSPFLEGFEVAGLSVAAEATGGDFFDYPPMGDDLLCVAVGECSGRGLAPTMLITSLRAYLRVLAGSTTDVSDIVSRANGLITEDVGDEEFLVTLMLVEVDRVTKRISYCSAGQQGHLIHRDGSVERLSSTGMPMGLQPDTVIPEGVNLRLQTGEMLLLTTDGVQKMTSTSGEHFGVDRMLEVVRENRQLPARMIVNYLHKAAAEFAGSNGQSDDLTIVLIKSEDE